MSKVRLIRRKDYSRRMHQKLLAKEEPSLEQNGKKMAAFGLLQMNNKITHRYQILLFIDITLLSKV